MQKMKIFIGVTDDENGICKNISHKMLVCLNLKHSETGEVLWPHIKVCFDIYPRSLYIKKCELFASYYILWLRWARLPDVKIDVALTKFRLLILLAKAQPNQPCIFWKIFSLYIRLKFTKIIGGVSVQ